jgi:predicted ATPase
MKQELTLQTALGASLIATEGYADPAVEQAYARARQLCLQLGEDPQLFPVLHGLVLFHAVRAELQLAREFAEQALRTAQDQQDPALLLEAHLYLGMLCFYLGKCREAREHLERSLAVYNPHHYRSHMMLYGQDPGVCALSVMAVLLWVMGYPEQAVQSSRDALALAERLSHPFSHAFALNFAADLAQFCRDGHGAQERAESVLEMAREQGFPYWAAQGAIVRGWSLGEQGNAEEEIPQAYQGLDALRATGAALDLPRYLALLVEGYRRRGQTEEGLKILADALAQVDKTGERFYEAELYRLKGELTLKKSGVQSPESKKIKNQKAKVKKQESLPLNT